MQVETELIEHVERIRLRVLILLILSGLSVLAVALWRLQVRQGEVHTMAVEKQSVRRVRLPAPRGRIFDINGVCLADTKPSYCIAIYIEELRQPGKPSKTIDKIDEVIAQVEKIIRIPRQVTRADIESHLQKRLPLPLLAWRNLDMQTVARWEESGVIIPGVDIEVQPVRFYPHGTVASHVLGYVTRTTSLFDNEEYDFYLPDFTGVSGVEKYYDERLRGEAGGSLIHVFASGYKYSETITLLPRPGKDIKLTIDIRIQKDLESALADVEGAGVVLDIRNGSILAMASMPAFDPNIMAMGITKEEWIKLAGETKNIFYNKAISGIYPPGSVFKPIVVVAALESGRANLSTAFECLGYFKIGNSKVRCWKESGHQLIALRKAIEQSCNAYFCQLGLLAGYDAIWKAAIQAGFTAKTGADLPGEVSGFLGNNEWKRKVSKERWTDGDTCNISIGQGYLTVTPLQVAVFMAAIANGGVLIQPHVILDDTGIYKTKKCGWSSETLRIIKDGMRDVIQNEEGTGKRARVEGVEMAGKTGTAEYGPKENSKNYAWIALFAPVSLPRYAVALVIEEGISGGRTAAPRAKQLMEAIFRTESRL